MGYQYSYKVDPMLYETHGLDGGIPLRVHADPESKEHTGSLRAQLDWSRCVRSVKGYKGGLGEIFSFISVCVPECLPERLEIVSYANEFAFLYDDEMERLIDSEANASVRDVMAQSFGGGVASQQARMLQTHIIAEMTAIDCSRALTTARAWFRFLQLAADSRSRSARTLDEYLPCRIVDAGELIWFGTLTFALALTIPDGELELCMELARPGYAAISLTNDLYSWDKERAEAESAGRDSVYNAIWVIMQEQMINEEEAKEVCRAKIKHYITRYCQIVEEVKQCNWLSDDLKVYLDAVRASHIGNLVWSISFSALS
ncbi:hypothetical protein BDV06DRAFT_234347 [Aspergillus oleicola]